MVEMLNMTGGSRNPIALVRSISTTFFRRILDFPGLRFTSQSHRFSEVYFHYIYCRNCKDISVKESQSHRFSEVYFHVR